MAQMKDIYETVNELERIKRMLGYIQAAAQNILQKPQSVSERATDLGKFANDTIMETGALQRDIDELKKKTWNNL